MKKKITSLCLCLIVILLLSACGNQTGIDMKNIETTQTAVPEKTAAPSGSENTGAFKVMPSDGVIDLSDIGMKITLPESVADIPIAVNGVANDDFVVANLCLADENDPDNQDCVFGEVFAYPDEMPHESLIDESSGMTGDMVMDLGSNESLYYYVFRLDELRKNSPETFEEIMDGLSEEKRTRYEALLDALPEVISGMEVTEMQKTADKNAEKEDSEYLIDQRMTDLQGKDTRLGDLLVRNQVTLINVWGITCGPCMEEMPVLQHMREQYKGQGFDVIGLAADLLDENDEVDPDLVSEAVEITGELGVEYQNLAMTKDLRQMLHVFATPTTYFVDGSGQMIGEPVLGTRSSAQWEELILNALAQSK